MSKTDTMVLELTPGTAVTATDVFESRSAFSVIDVRETKEYAGDLGHIAGSQLVPLSQLREQQIAVSAGISDPMVVVCRSGLRAAKAMALLQLQGYERLYVMEQGMMGWKAAGLPTCGDSHGSSPLGCVPQRQTRAG